MGVKKDTLAGSQSPKSDPREGNISTDNHARFVKRLSRGKEKSLEVLDYLKVMKLTASNAQKTWAKKVHERQVDCGDWLLCRMYPAINETRIHKASFCKQDKTCMVCAILKASKAVGAYLPKFETLQLLVPELKPYMVTLTVKDGPDVVERLEHLVEGLRKLNKRRRDYVNTGWGSSVWCAVEGAVGGIEIKKGKNSGEWHVHVHLIVLAQSMPTELEYIDANGNERWRCRALEKEWHGITGDSFVVDVRPFGEKQCAVKSFCEVFKYALEFGSMSPADNCEVAYKLKGRRLRVSYGLFRGVEVPEELTDDPIEGLEYIEVFYTFLRGSGYNLEAVFENESLV